MQNPKKKYPRFLTDVQIFASCKVDRRWDNEIDLKKVLFQKNRKNAFSKFYPDSKLKVSKTPKTPLGKIFGEKVYCTNSPKSVILGVSESFTFRNAVQETRKAPEKKKCKSVKFREFPVLKFSEILTI
jgi:hypothetical protein